MALNPIAYLKESRVELEKVVWPSRGQTLRLTIMVIAVSILVGAYVAGLDALFSKLVEKFLR